MARCKFSRSKKKGQHCKRVKGGALLCCSGTRKHARRRKHRR